MKSADIVGTVKRHEGEWKGENHNYRSWERCYKFFCSKPRDRDLACLYLTAYFSSHQKIIWYMKMLLLQLKDTMAVSKISICQVL
jgi:hypothetical protein